MCECPICYRGCLWYPHWKNPTSYTESMFDCWSPRKTNMALYFNVSSGLILMSKTQRQPITLSLSNLSIFFSILQFSRKVDVHFLQWPFSSNLANWRVRTPVCFAILTSLAKREFLVRFHFQIPDHFSSCHVFDRRLVAVSKPLVQRFQADCHRHMTRVLLVASWWTIEDTHFTVWHSLCDQLSIRIVEETFVTFECHCAAHIRRR